MRGEAKQQGSLREWLLTYNLGMLLIILVVAIILFGLLFNLLEQMQSRNSRYEAVNTFSRQLGLHRGLFSGITAEGDPRRRAGLLEEMAILDRDLRVSLHRLQVDHAGDRERHFIQRGIANGLQFIDEAREILLSMADRRQTPEYFSLYYTTEKVYSYLQDYAVNRYLPSLVRSDIAWILATEHEILNYRAVSILFFILIAIIYGVVTYEMNMRLVRPVSAMVDAAREIFHGRFDGTEIPLEGPAEIRYLEQSMNQMRASLKERMEMIERNALLEKTVHRQELERIKTTRELEKARYQTLQSQINPHFLFNTLNVISRTALFEGAHTTVDLLDSLASIFRYSLQLHDDVTLQEELQFVRRYLTIQQHRFKERLRFSVESPADLDELRIPPLIIQPFVENAMIHGLEPKVEGGEVAIAVIEEAGQVLITVTDTGVGIDPARIDAVTAKDSRRIGIRNITDRLELYYKGRASVAIAPANGGEGTRVSIRLPRRSGGRKHVHAPRR